MFQDKHDDNYLYLRLEYGLSLNKLLKFSLELLPGACWMLNELELSLSMNELVFI